MFRFCLCVVLLLLSAAARAMSCPEPVVVVDKITFAGNAITKSHVLEQELTFAPGDTLAAESLEPLLEENQARLLNLRLFHQVAYAYSCQGGRVEITYQMQERFYLYPVPVFDVAERNFNAWLERKDWGRLDYGLNLIRYNFRGRNENLRLRVQQGFNRRLELAYRVPYISRRHQLGAEFSVADYRSRAISYKHIRNKQHFYEQETGLPIRRTAVGAGLIHRQNVQRQAGLRLSYHQEQISDSVLLLNPEYFGEAAGKREYMRLEAYKVVNLRNNFAYPLTGSYLEAGVAQTLFLHGAGMPYTAIRAKYAHYARLTDKLYYALSAEGQLRLAKEHAFADNVALGFRSWVRGYELYVVGGQHYALLKQGLSRRLFGLDGIRLKFIDNPKFNRVPLAMYLSAFADAAYVEDNVYGAKNPLTNRLLAGAGLGLHLVTFYDIVLRLEYALNREGEKGLYFGTSFPI